MPLKIDVVAPYAIPIFAKELDKEGYQHYDYGIDEVEIRDIDIEEARTKHHSVRIGIYDFVLNEAWDGEKGYHQASQARYPYAAGGTDLALLHYGDPARQHQLHPAGPQRTENHYRYA